MPEDTSTHAETASLEVHLLPLGEIEQDPNQPRKVFDRAALDELAAAIEDSADGSETPWIDGLLHPVVVYPSPAHEKGTGGPAYRLFTGARRLRAYQHRGWPVIPARIVETPATAARILLTQLNENQARKDTTLWEDATAVQRAFEAWKTERGGTAREFAREFGRSPAWVSKHLFVARAQGLARTALEEGHINHDTAYRLFARLPVEEQRRLVLAARRDGVAITARRVREVLPQRRAGGAEAPREGSSPAASRGLGEAPSVPSDGLASGPSEEPGGSAPATFTLRLPPPALRRLLQALGAKAPADDAHLATALFKRLNALGALGPTSAGEDASGDGAEEEASGDDGEAEPEPGQAPPAKASARPRTPARHRRSGARKKGATKDAAQKATTPQPTAPEASS